MHYPCALETVEGCAWYIFNFIQIFPSSETHPNVARGSVEYSAKGLVKDLAAYFVASSFLYPPKINSDPCTIVPGIYLILVRFFLLLKLTKMLLEVVRNI